MKLTGIGWQGFSLPFLTPYVTSNTRARFRYGLLLSLTTDHGLTSIGEASPVGVSSRSEIARLATEIEILAPELLGTEVTAAERQVATLGIPASLSFGLETALLDLKGKDEGLPLMGLLGGNLQSVPVNALIASERPREAVAEAERAVAQGFTSLKLKVAHGSLDRDEALVSSVRQAVGPAIKLRIDANQSWNPSQAIHAIKRLSQYDLEYVEQPVPAGDLAGLSAVKRSAPIPVAADEALSSLHDLRRIVAADAADLFIIKVARLGGLIRALEIMQASIEAGKGVVVTSSLESGVGLAASVHLACISSSHIFAQGLSTGLLFTGDLTSPHILPEAGMIPAPWMPGLGVNLDMPQLERFSISIGGSVGLWQGFQ